MLKYGLNNHIRFRHHKERKHLIRIKNQGVTETRTIFKKITSDILHQTFLKLIELVQKEIILEMRPFIFFL